MRGGLLSQACPGSSGSTSQASSLHTLAATALEAASSGGGCATISIEQNEAHEPVRIRSQSFAEQQNSIGSTSGDIAQPLFDSDEVPYISLDEFLSTDSEELKNTDLCVRLPLDGSTIDSQGLPHHQNHPVILTPIPPLVAPQPSHQGHSKAKGCQPGPMRNNPLTPSPSSTSSQDNEDDSMGHLGRSRSNFNFYGNENQQNVQLNYQESGRLSVSSAAISEGSDDDLQLGVDLSGRKPVRRRSKKPVPDEKKDEIYWRRRHKNNIAAKRSREARRQKETDLNQRVSLLEMEHDKLRTDLESALQENNELKIRLSKYEDVSMKK